MSYTKEVGLRVVRARERAGMNQAELSKKTGINVSVMNRIEQGTRKARDNEILAIAQATEVSTDYLLLGNESDKKKHYYDLTEKDERDIARDLEKMIADLSDGGALAFSKDTSEVDEETRELLIASLENSLRIAKIEAKKKFTPKKYRD